MRLDGKAFAQPKSKNTIERTRLYQKKLVRVGSYTSLCRGIGIGASRTGVGKRPVDRRYFK